MPLTPHNEGLCPVSYLIRNTEGLVLAIQCLHCHIQHAGNTVHPLLLSVSSHHKLVTAMSVLYKKRKLLMTYCFVSTKNVQFQITAWQCLQKQKQQANKQKALSNKSIQDHSFLKRKIHHSLYSVLNICIYHTYHQARSL